MVAMETALGHVGTRHSASGGVGWRRRCHKKGHLDNLPFRRLENGLFFWIVIISLFLQGFSGLRIAGHNHLIRFNASSSSTQGLVHHMPTSGIQPHLIRPSKTVVYLDMLFVNLDYDLMTRLPLIPHTSRLAVRPDMGMAVCFSTHRDYGALCYGISWQVALGSSSGYHESIIVTDDEQQASEWKERYYVYFAGAIKPSSFRVSISISHTHTLQKNRVLPKQGESN